MEATVFRNPDHTLTLYPHHGYNCNNSQRDLLWLIHLAYAIAIIARRSFVAFECGAKNK